MADTKKSLAQVASGSATTESSLIGVDNGTVKRFPITALVDLMYPVGSYYWSSNPTDPETLFGGTWEAVENKFIYAASTSHPVGETGGAEAVALTLNQMPVHSHTASTGSAGSHNHYSDLKGTNDEMLNAGLVANAAFAGRCYVTGGNLYSSTNGSHSHTVSVSSTGGSAAHNNMPPYITAYCWHRTA